MSTLPDLAPAYPPRPRLTFRVGVTGHRWGASLDPDAQPRIIAQLRAILAESGAAAQAIRQYHAMVFAPEPPRLIALSPLAEGGDRLLASEALAAGWSLEAVLPFAAGEYEKDFETAERKAEFRSLLSRAASVFEIADPRSSEDSSEAYETAGLVMLDNADLVIAIWDGRESRGRGGTREILDEAVRRGTPVVWVHATEAQPPAMWDGQAAVPLPELDGEAEGPSPRFREVLTRLLAPPSAAVPEDAEAARRLAAFLAEDGRPAPWWTRGYDIMLWVTAKKPLRLFAPRPSVAGRTGEWDGFIGDLPPNGPLAERLRSVLLARFLWADHVATQFGRAYRGAYVLNFTLAALAVATGLQALFYWDSLLAKTQFVTIEFILIALILAVTRAGGRNKWHQRFLDARRLAEMLRHGRVLAPLARAAGGGEPGHPDPGERWTSWYAQAALRELGIPQAHADAGYLKAVADATLAHEVEPQIRYHHNNHHTLHKVHHGLDHVGEFAFYLTAVLCLVWIVLAGIYAVWEPYWIKYQAKPLLTFLAAVLPAIGAALAGIRAQGDYDASAKRSHATERELEQIAAHIRQGPPADYRQACLLQVWAADTMATDLGSWRSLYSHRPLTIPG